MTLSICIPGTSWNYRMAVSLVHTIRYLYLREIEFSVHTATGCNLFEIRNQLAADALQRPADKMLWIDSDIVWDIDQIDRLLSHDLPVVSGLYRSHTGRHVAGYFDMDYFKIHGNLPRYDPDAAHDELHPIGWAGFGFILIDPMVFKFVQYPWFTCDTLKHGGQSNVMGEDISFCKRLSEAEIPVYLDTTLKVSHVKEFLI